MNAFELVPCEECEGAGEVPAPFCHSCEEAIGWRTWGCDGFNPDCGRYGGKVACGACGGHGARQPDLAAVQAQMFPEKKA